MVRLRSRWGLATRSAALAALALSGASMLSPRSAAQEPKAGKAAACLVLMHHAKEGEPKPDLRMNHFALPDPKLRARLKALGFEVSAAPYASGLTMDFLKQFNVVVMPHPYLRGYAPGLDDMAAEKQQLLLDYVQAGGGLLVLRTQGWQFGEDIDELNRWLAPLDLEIPSEQVVDDEHKLTLESGSKLSWTDNLATHPVTEGVGGIFYTTYHHMYSDSTSPVKPGKDWTVLLRGKATTRSMKTVKGAKPPPPTPGTYASEPPLLAVRDYGKGRVAVWPVNSTIIWQDGYHMLWGRGLVMDGESSGMRGDGAKLVENLLTYLAEPSRGEFGGFKPPPKEEPKPELGFVTIDWDKDGYSGAYMPHCFVGLIGVKSALSSGTGSPAQFIQAAQEAGYDFVGFTEDLDQLTEAEFGQLQETCKTASTDKFKAYPGFAYLDESGNSWVTFSDRLRWPEPGWWSAKHAGRIKVNNALWRGCRFPPVILLHPHGNPEKAAFQGNFKGLSVYTYASGKLLDDALDVYLRLQRMRYELCPVAVHLVTSPEQVKPAKSTGYQTYVRWNDHSMAEALSSHIPAYKGTYIFTRSCFISEGPILEDNRIRNFATSDLVLPANDRIRIHIRASAPGGLREVAILDADAPRPWRRFLPGGKDVFDATIDHFHDRQYNLILTATDTEGRKALGWNAWTAVQENNYPRCSDNLNTMPRGKWWGAPKHMQNVRGIENYQAVRNFRYLGVPLLEGLAESVRAAIEYYPVLVCRFGTILDCLIDDHHPVSASANLDHTDLPELAEPNVFFGGKVRHTLFTPWQDGALITLVEGDFTAKQDIESKRAQILSFNGRQGADCVSATRPDGRLYCAKLNTRMPHCGGELPLNGFAAILPQPFRGSVGMIALQEGLRYLAFTGGSDMCNFRGLLWDGKRTVKAGEKLTYRYLGVNSALDAPPDTRFVAEIVDTLGLGREPAYQVRPTTGSVTGTRFILNLQADGYAFTGTLTEAKLPLNLPVMIAGLNPRWHAGVWYKGSCRLHTAEWVVNDMNQRWTERRVRTVKDEIQHFPVMEDGVGFLQLNTTFGAKNVTIGNLLVSDNPNVCLTLVDRRPGREAFVIHNPTDAAIACEVRPGPGFTLLGDFRSSMTVPPGSSVRKTVK